ncbi:MAG: Gfo/Idh/MocA family protein [Paracoccaceae bacterium]
MSGPLRLGLVGAGAIARAYAQAIAETDAARLVAVADMNGIAAAAMAGANGAEAFASHEALAASGLCDAVLVTTPPVTHAGIVVDLVERGLPVLCEKPFSVDLASARRMARAAEANGVLLSMASKFRFSDDVIAARAMLAAGEIGTPMLIENVFTGVADMTKRWNSDPLVAGGGVLIDNGTHSVDIVRYLLGPITEVLAVAGPRMQAIAVEDSVTLFAHTAGGAQAQIETSWSYHKDRASFIGIHGTAGTIEVGWKGSRIRRGGTLWEPFGTGYDKVASFRRQIEHFAATLRGEDKALPNLDDALASVAVIQAAYRSMTNGGWAGVDPLEARPPQLEAVG